MADGGRPKQYRARLSPSEVAQGMSAAARNAMRLAADAKILFDAGRYPSASSLAILAIEEAGKLAVLRGIATAPTEEHLKQAWKDYRDHKAKNAAWIILDLARRGAKYLDDLRVIFDPSSDHPTILDSVKQISFYTDCYADRHWSEPEIVISRELAQSMIFIAEVLCPKHETTAREMELWVEYVGPHWGTPEMYWGTVRFQAAMEKEGLARHTPEEMERFLFGLGAKSSSPKPSH